MTRCWWFFHLWTKWTEIDIVLHFPYTGRESITVAGQTRYCLRCGKRQRREI